MRASDFRRDIQPEPQALLIVDTPVEWLEKIFHGRFGYGRASIRDGQFEGIAGRRGSHLDRFAFLAMGHRIGNEVGAQLPDARAVAPDWFRQ